MALALVTFGAGVNVVPEKAKAAAKAKATVIPVSTDIPQVYITADNITNEYHENADVSIKVVDQEGGSDGLACIDDTGAHRDKATIQSYPDIVDNECNIKIRGNTTSWQPKKSWNIKFSKKVSVLGIDKGKKWCLLANSMDKSLMRDTLAYNFALQNGVRFTSQSRYVDVYLNDVYQGNYQLCEPVEAKSGRVDINAYDAESDDILLEVGTRNEEGVDHFTTSVYKKTFDVNDPEKGDDLSDDEVNAKIARAKTFLNVFENILKNDVNNTEALQECIDFQTFADFFIVTEVFKNMDIAYSSTRFYISDNKLYAGPAWDFDLSSGNANSSYYKEYYQYGDSAIGMWCTRYKWYERLMLNSDFSDYVKQRFYDLQYQIQSLYREDSTEINSINYLVNRFGASFERNYKPKNQQGAGWQMKNNDGYSYAMESDWVTWEDPINFLRDWLVRRNEWLSSEWNIDMEEAYAKGKAAVETTTPEPPTTETTTPKPTSKTTSAKKNNLAPAGVNPKSPAKTKVKKAVKKSAKKIKITLKKVKGASGYQVAVYKSKKAAKKNKGYLVRRFMRKAKGFIKTSKFKGKKRLFIRARAYIQHTRFKTFSGWSKVKKIK